MGHRILLPPRLRQILQRQATPHLLHPAELHSLRLRRHYAYHRAHLWRQPTMQPVRPDRHLPPVLSPPRGAHRVSCPRGSFGRRVHRHPRERPHPARTKDDFSVDTEAGYKGGAGGGCGFGRGRATDEEAGSAAAEAPTGEVSAPAGLVPFEEGASDTSECSPSVVA
jgi:hypothetical protein